MAQELKVCEAYICHNEFSYNELPQKKDAIVKSASHKEEDDWWDYAAKIECYRKEDVGKVIAEKNSENESLLQQNRKLKHALWLARAERALEKIAWFKLWNTSISTMNPEDGDRQEFDRWKKAFGKFLAKAEEYK